MYFQKNPEILKGRGFTIMEFWGHGGVTHFGISEGKEGLKHGSRPCLGMDIFWNCPFRQLLHKFKYSQRKKTSLFRWVFFLLLLQYLICFKIVIITFIEGAQLAKAVFSGALFISCTSYLFVSSQWTCYFCQCTGIMRDFKGQSRLQTVYFNGGSLSWWKSQILSLSLFQPSSYALNNTN